jgi:hypothetical protein
VAVPFRRAYVKRYVRYNSVRRGLLGGSRIWTAVFAARYVGQFVTKVTKRGVMPVITSDRLEPGEGMVIRHLAPGERPGDD